MSTREQILEKAISDACDLLAERTYGSPARSPGHNARLRLEQALVASVYTEAHAQDAATRALPPPPEGAIRSNCVIDKLPSGLWMFYSPDWRGMLLAHRDLSKILASVPFVGKQLLKAMDDHHAKTPYTDPGQLAQMERYRSFFSDVPDEPPASHSPAACISEATPNATTVAALQEAEIARLREDLEALRAAPTKEEVELRLEVVRLRKEAAEAHAEVVHTQDELGALLHAAEAKLAQALSQVEEAKDIMAGLFNFDMGSAERALKFLDDGLPTHEDVRGILSDTSTELEPK